MTQKKWSHQQRMCCCRYSYSLSLRLHSHVYSRPLPVISPNGKVMSRTTSQITVSYSLHPSNNDYPVLIELQLCFISFSPFRNDALIPGWQIACLKSPVTPGLTGDILDTVIDTENSKLCQSRIKIDLANLMWGDGWREKDCAYAHAHGSAPRDCTMQTLTQHNTVKSKWDKICISISIHVTHQIFCWSLLLTVVLHEIHADTKLLFFVFAVFWAKSKPLIIPESKKDNLSLISPAVKVKCVYRSVLGLSQPLAQFFMIKGGGGGKKPVGQPATWSHAQCCPWPG